MLLKKIITHIIWRTKFTWSIIIPQVFLSFFLPKRVLSGPFKGMNYLGRSTGSVILPKLIGTYENELHSALNTIRSCDYDSFIDIGAAEGYYAIGVKKFILPEVQQVVAFEKTKRGQRLIKDLASKNSVQNIDIRGFCDGKVLSSVLSDKRAFVIMDIEGGEFDLLTSTEINYSNCDMLIEVHYVNGLDRTAKITDRFSQTHEISFIEKQKKDLPSNLSLSPLIRKNADYVVNEFRNRQSWLFLKSQRISRHEILNLA